VLSKLVTPAFLGGLLATAHANIGDTFEISCQRFGQANVRPGGGQLVAYWDVGKEAHYFIYEYFTNGRCDAIVYVKPPGLAFDEFEVRNFLAGNAMQGEEWQERPSPIGRTFVTTDNKLGAGLLLDAKSNRQFLRIATAAAIEWDNP
jgi:hypothetical protein